MNRDKLIIWFTNLIDVLMLIGLVYCGIITWYYPLANPTLTNTQLYIELYYHKLFGFIGVIWFLRYFN